MSDLHQVQALLFDVFGTVVDWHGSVTKELETLGKTYGIGLFTGHLTSDRPR
jgi:FMN phosphatase YigB (HAD superfamily)